MKSLWWPHLILIEGSPGLVGPQLGAEPEGAVLGDVGRGGGEGQVGVRQLGGAQVVGGAWRGFGVGTLDQHTLTPGHFHPEQRRFRSGLHGEIIRSKSGVVTRIMIADTTAHWDPHFLEVIIAVECSFNCHLQHHQSPLSDSLVSLRETNFSLKFLWRWFRQGSEKRMNNYERIKGEFHGFCTRLGIFIVISRVEILNY